MNEKCRQQPKETGSRGLRNRRRPILFLLIAALLLLVVGCSSAADEQATAERMTVVAADEIAALTREAETEAATSQAIEMAASTAEAATMEAEEELAAQATADAQASADAQATADAEATEIAQATANAEATAEAEAQATADSEATRAAFEAEKVEMVEDAQSETPIASLEDGSLVHDEDDEPETEAANVDLRNFVVQTQFAFEAGETEFDEGVLGLRFRSSAENVTGLVIGQDGHWQLLYEESGGSEIVQEGEMASLNDGWNEVVLYVDEEDGFFLLNGDFVDELDLKETAETGDIVVATGLDTGSEVTGASLAYKEFTVWSLDPIPPTPTPAPAPSSPQAPPPPASSGAPTFPQTPIKPFNRDEFVSYVGQMRDSFRSFNSEMNLMMQTGKYGDCGTFNGWWGLWIAQSPGYTDVPPNFSALYGEYRSLLSQVVGLTQEIREVCSVGGGDVTPETLIAIVEFLSWAYPRSEQMVSEASVLP